MLGEASPVMVFDANVFTNTLLSNIAFIAKCTNDNTLLVSILKGRISSGLEGASAMKQFVDLTGKQPY